MILSFAFVFAPIQLTQNTSSLAQAADMARRKQAERLALEKAAPAKKRRRRVGNPPSQLAQFN